MSNVSAAAAEAAEAAAAGESAPQPPKTHLLLSHMLSWLECLESVKKDTVIQ